MDDFIAAGTEDGGAEDLFRPAIDSDLDEPLGLSLLKSAADPDHGIFRRKRRTARLSNFAVRHAAAAQRRINVKRVSLDSVRNPAVISVQKIVGHDLIVVV